MTGSPFRLLAPAVAFAAAVILLAGASFQAPSATLSAQEPQTLFRADVDVVPLNVTARDAAGRIVHDLRRDEFEVSEEGDRQDVAHFAHHEAPISVAVLLDHSGSMFGEKLMHAKDGIIAFVKALRQQDEVLLIAFSDTIQALGSFGMDRRVIEREVEKLDVDGGTRLYDAVIAASAAITAPGRHEKRALLILSDGADNGSRAPLDQAVAAVRSAGVPAYAIGIEMGVDEPSSNSTSQIWRSLDTATGQIAGLKRLSDGTGGWTYPVDAARRCKEICLRVAEELRNQYLLGYYPSDQRRDGGWRRITVRTVRPGITLSTRDGYFAPSS